MASTISKDVCPSEVLSLELAGDRSIVNGNSLLVDTTDKAVSVPSTGPLFHEFNSNNTPCNYW